MDKKLKVAIIGCGNISHSHIQAYLKNPQVEVIAVCDQNKQRAEDYAKSYNIPLAFGDVDELLKLDNVSSIKESKYDEKFEKFHKYLETGLDINSPVIIFSNDVNGVFGVHIEDGRHRFAILRDMGMKKIPVAVSKDSLKYLKNFALV